MLHSWPLPAGADIARWPPQVQRGHRSTDQQGVCCLTHPSSFHIHCSPAFAFMPLPPPTNRTCPSHHSCPSHCMHAAGAPPAQHHVLLCVHCPKWCTLADVRPQLHQGLGLQLRETPHTSGMPQATVAVQNSSSSHISFNRCTLATLVRWPRYSLLAKCVSPWQSPSASGCTMEAVL